MCQHILTFVVLSWKCLSIMRYGWGNIIVLHKTCVLLMSFGAFQFNGTSCSGSFYYFLLQPERTQIKITSTPSSVKCPVQNQDNTGKQMRTKHLLLVVTQISNAIKVRLVPSNMFKPFSIFLTYCSKTVFLLWILYLLFVFCVCLSYCLFCTLQPCSHLLGKCWTLCSRVYEVLLCFLVP